MARPVPVDSPLALLIDADNTPYSAMKQILDETARYGRAIIKNAYGDWSTPDLQKWKDVFREFAIRPIQQIRYTTGKNSTDSALIINAMDILHQGKVESFVLVTSDSDFTSLAMRIREEGFKVIGIGRKTTPPSFVAGCDKFVYLETLVSEQIVEKKTTTQRTNSIPSDGKDVRLKGRELLVTAVMKAADETGIVKGAHLGLMLRRIDPSFDPIIYGAKRLTEFVGLYPDVLVPTGKKSGEDPTYKVNDEILGAKSKT